MQFLSQCFSKPITELKPMSILKTIRYSLNLYFDSFSTLFIYTGLYLLTLLAGHYSLLTVGNYMDAYFNGALSTPRAKQYIMIQALLLLIFLLIKSLLFISCYIRLNDCALKQKSQFTHSFKIALQKILPFLGVNILILMIIVTSFCLFFIPVYYLITDNQLERLHIGFLITGFITCIIPSIILTYYLIFAPFLVLLNKIGIMEACSLSYRLVKSHWWRTCILLDIPALLIVGLTLIPIVITLVFNYPVLQFKSMAVLLLVYTLQAASLPLLQAFIIGCLTNLKLRKSLI